LVVIYGKNGSKVMVGIILSSRGSRMDGPTRRVDGVDRIKAYCWLFGLVKEAK
jgi:hypothetical protein